VTPRLVTRGRDRSEFGRDVEDIIAEVEGRNRPADQTDPIVWNQACPDQSSDTALNPALSERRIEENAVTLQAKSDGRLDVPWQWVMFAEPVSGGIEFLGVFVTRAFSGDDAVFKAHVTGNCPGGHADAVALPPGLPIDASDCDRLLTLAECEALRERLGTLSN